MNREKVIELACAAQLPRYFRTGDVVNVEQLERFASLVEKEIQTNYFNPDWDVVAPMIEEQKRMALRIEELENALSQLLAILGPTAPTCCGCAVEWQAAIDLIKGAIEMSKETHELWCASLNVVLPTMPPQRAHCNCRNIKWDASAPVLLSDGRATRFADGSIGIGTPSSETLMFMPQPPTEEILNVSKSGVFTWHPDADKLIEEVQYNPALQHILRVLRKATND